MNSDTTPLPQESSKGGTVQVVLLVVLLLIGFVSGGYYFGTQMNFKNLAGGSTPVGSTNDNETATFGGFSESSQLKKAYWLKSGGYERAGFMIKVYLNGQFVGKFFKPDVIIECTKFLKPGHNTITFQAKSLPVDQRSDYATAHLDIDLKAGEKKMDGDTPRYENGDTLLDYSRKVTDTEDNKETKEFETLE